MEMPEICGHFSQISSTISLLNKKQQNKINYYFKQNSLKSTLKYFFILFIFLNLFFKLINGENNKLFLSTKINISEINNEKFTSEQGCVMRDICGVDGELRQNCRFLFLKFNFKLLEIKKNTPPPSSLIRVLFNYLFSVSPLKFLDAYIYVKLVILNKFLLNKIPPFVLLNRGRSEMTEDRKSELSEIGIPTDL